VGEGRSRLHPSSALSDKPYDFVGRDIQIYSLDVERGPMSALRSDNKQWSAFSPDAYTAVPERLLKKSG
jgi:hypothetical protein